MGGLILRKYASHDNVTPPNTPGSKTSTPLRTPSAFTGNNAESPPSAGGGGPSAVARSMSKWLSPPPRAAGVKEPFSEGLAPRLPHLCRA